MNVLVKLRRSPRTTYYVESVVAISHISHKHRSLDLPDIHAARDYAGKLCEIGNEYRVQYVEEHAQDDSEQGKN